MWLIKTNNKKNWRQNGRVSLFLLAKDAVSTGWMWWMARDKYSESFLSLLRLIFMLHYTVGGLICYPKAVSLLDLCLQLKTEIIYAVHSLIDPCLS